MKTNKIFGVKSITNLIYGLIVLLPMFAILGRTIYVQANPNAKDSYSQVSTSITNVVSQGEATIEGMTYQLVYTGGEYVNNQTYYVINGNTNIVDLFFPNETWKVDRFTTYMEHGNTRLIVYDLNNTQHNKFDWELVSNSFYFVNKNTLTLPNTTMYYKLTYTTYSYGKLDNAFEYSISEFTKDNNFGEVDMFGWFTNMFLDTSNAKNQLYVGFVNWYLNYTMLVSSGYLLFLVLIWFINFIRRIMDKSMYQDYGGF